MEWEDILKYEKDIRNIAFRWGQKHDISLIEDAVQHTFVMLRESVNLEHATGPEREYIKGAIWNIIHKFFETNKKTSIPVSLDKLCEDGVQIDEEGNPRWPSSGEYSGDYKTDGKKKV